MALSDRELKVCTLIGRRGPALLEDLRLHVGIATGLGHRPGLDETRERFTARCRALGAHVELVPGDARPEWIEGGGPGADRAPSPPPPPTAVCRRLDASARGGVLIAGHLDTVHDPAGAFRSLNVESGGKRATGPGCVDMKGGLVIAMAALEALEEAGERVAWSFLMNSDEETGSFHSARALHSEGASGRYACALALEPAMSDGGLAVARGGSGQFMIEARGRAAHVGRDFAAGVSAVDALARTIVEAHALSRVDAGSGAAGGAAGGGPIAVNIGPLWCPTPTNVVPALARAWGNVRFPSPHAGNELAAALRALARGGPEHLPHVSVQHVLNRPAKPLTDATRALAEAARAACADLGQALPFGSTGGVCDGNNLQAAGLPTIDTLGVRGGGLHTPQEWIDLTSLVERCQVLAVLMIRLSGSC